MTLRKQIFDGVRWTAVSSIVRVVIQFANIAILARLLTPNDFGLIAIVIALQAILLILADAGVSNAIIHYQNITQEQLSSLYWLNVGVSVMLAGMLIASSPWLADWYNQPVLQSLLAIAAAVIIVGAMEQQLRINAQKEMRFAQLAKVEILGVLGGFIVAVGLAWNGAGVYALSVGPLMGALVSCASSWLILAQGWRPQWRFRFCEIRQFLQFGSYMIGNNIANTINSQIDVLLGARLLGSEAIGLYSVPKNLTMNVQMAINPIITKVGLPVMAKVQGDTDMLKSVYLNTMRMSASINFPLYVIIVLFAPEIILFVVGEKWNSAIPLLQIFGIWGLLRSIANPVGSLLIATGRVKRSFIWNMALVVIIVPIIWVGSQYGLEGIAFAMVGLMAGLMMPLWYFLIRPSCGASLGEYSKQLVTPLIIALVAGLCGYLAAGLFTHDLIRLILGFMISCVVYLIVSWYFNRTWVDAMTELLKGHR